MKAALVALLVLAGCVADTPKPGTMPDAERTQCVMAGGHVGGSVLGDTCFFATKDAGQSCRKATDCEGACLATTGTCARQRPTLGCFDARDETGERVSLCVE